MTYPEPLELDHQDTCAEHSSGIKVETSGGTYISGNVSTGGGTFVGRDIVIHLPEEAFDVQGLPNPYLGLRPFKYEDRFAFGGREKLVDEAVSLLVTPNKEQVMLFVTGASGSGKSSFVQAGVLPVLIDHYSARHKTVCWAVLHPGHNPNDMLNDAVSQLHPQFHKFEDLLRYKSPKQINLLVIDQFEECFTQSTSSARNKFLNYLVELPPFEEIFTHIIITLRSDYLNELFEIEKLWDIAIHNSIQLRVMNKDALQSAIQKPIKNVYPQGEKRLEPSLLEKLSQDASSDAALLPLLQVTLEELWKQGWLMLRYYGNLTDSIKERAELVYTYEDYVSSIPHVQRPDQHRAEIEAIFLDLVNVSLDDDFRRDVRCQRTKRDLEMLSPVRGRLVEALINARLLTTTTEIIDGQRIEFVNIIHESLISNWDRFHKNIADQRQNLQQRTRFEQLLKEWQSKSYSVDYLLQGIRLAEARELQKAGDIALRSVEANEFLRHSAELESSEEQRKLSQVEALAAEYQRVIQEQRLRIAEQERRIKAERDRMVAEARARTAMDNAERVRAFLLIAPLILGILVFLGTCSSPY